MQGIPGLGQTAAAEKQSKPLPEWRILISEKSANFIPFLNSTK